jgi:hypothetical protein
LAVTVLSIKSLVPDIHYQVDLTGTPDQVRLSGLPDEHTHYQVNLMGALDLPDSELLALEETQIS